MAAPAPDNSAPDAAPDGPTPVLFVHGLMSNSGTWSGQLERMAGARRLIAPDLFGHGDSAKPAGDYSLGAHAATLRDLLDEIGVERVTVVGHSLGGGIALQFSYLFPSRITGLVLVSSGGLGKELNPLLRAATLPGSELVLPVSPRGGSVRSGTPPCSIGGGSGCRRSVPAPTRRGATSAPWRTHPPGPRSWPPAGR
jgi:pimeloyl-ACP methyl ester carboxylesterase